MPQTKLILPNNNYNELRISVKNNINTNYNLKAGLYKGFFDYKFKHKGFNERLEYINNAYNANLIGDFEKNKLIKELIADAKTVRHAGVIYELPNNFFVFIVKTSKPFHNNNENIIVGSFINPITNKESWVYMSTVPFYVQFKEQDNMFYEEFRTLESGAHWPKLLGNAELIQEFKDAVVKHVQDDTIKVDNASDLSNYIFFKDKMYSIISLYLYENVYGDEMIYNPEVQEKAYNIIDKFDKNPELFLKENINYKSEYLLNKNVSHDFGDLSPGKLPEE